MIEPSANDLERLSRWITNRMRVDGTPGLSLAICDRSEIVHTEAFGLADIGSRTPVSPDHLFEIGSIGKSFTATALLQLVDEGLIDLQAPVTDYLPWFAVQSAFEPIRLHHLLTHTAGITSGIDFAPASTIQVLELRNTVAANPPGTYFHYSNVGYKVLGEVLRAVTGFDYGRVIQDRILDRLNLTGSVPTIINNDRHRLAVGYGPLHDDRPWWPGRPLVPATWLETDTADGCLAMTASDLATYLRMLLNGGTHGDDRVLSEAGFAALTQCAIAMDEPPDSAWYGYGIQTSIVDGHTRIGHGGGMVGYFAGMIGDLETGVGVVALVNGPGAPNLIAKTALAFINSLRDGSSFAFPDLEDTSHVDGASAYAGEYRAVEGTFGPSRVRIAATSEPGLTVATPDGEAPLFAYEDDVFVTAEEGLDRFPICFDADADRPRQFTYGDTRYLLSSEPLREMEPYPAEWTGLAGFYRSHNPWTTCFWVVIRAARLHLIIPSEPDGFAYEQPLVPLDDGWFRAGDDPRIPERVRFDAMVDGQAQRASLSGADFYRAHPA